MKLAEGTLRSWFGRWQRSASKPKPAAKTLPKGKSDKPPAKEKANETPATAVEIPGATIASLEPAVLTA